jgi:hypothetical protein
MIRRSWQSLIAVLAANAVYFGTERYLPPRAQHHSYQIDWGLAVDFWTCLGVLRTASADLLTRATGAGCRADSSRSSRGRVLEAHGQD